MATKLVVTKGQPYRFGVVDSSHVDQNSILVRFASEPSVDQLKSVSPISIVPIEKAYVSPSLSLAMLLASRPQDIQWQLSSANTWLPLFSSKPVVLIVNRKYLLQRLRQELFDSRSDIDFNRAKLETRKALRDVETGWRSSIIMPKVVPLLLRSEGWNNRVQKLFVEPYQPLPVGRVTHQGVHKNDEYPASAVPANLSDGDDKLAILDSGKGLALICVDDLNLPSGHQWPKLVGDCLTPRLSHLLQDACLVIIDQAKTRHEYELALGRSLQYHKTSLGSLLPLQTSEYYNDSSDIMIDTFATDQACVHPPDLKSMSGVQAADYSSFADVFSTLYPDLDNSTATNSIALRHSIKIFEAESFLQERVLLNFGYKHPGGLEDLVGAARLLLGLMPPLIHAIYERSSRILLLQSSDLGSMVPGFNHLSQYEHSTASSDPPEYILLSLTSDDFSAYCFDTDTLISFLQAACPLNLENPYRLEKKLSAEQRLIVERFQMTSRLLVVILS